eukprot:GHVU01227730.1.p1 GENE.GHVU01227730.1~~GHVU01227730.1.p1  ORF type:complete len:127 (-),score=24.56 GHVU01227730.1:254-634(-)
MLRAVGQYWTYAEIQKITEEMRRSGNESATFKHFCGFARKKRNSVPDRDELRRAFEVFDRSGSGRVGVAELRHILTSIGEPLQSEEFDELLRMSNLHRTSHVGIEQFMRLVLGPRYNVARTATPSR